MATFFWTSSHLTHYPLDLVLARIADSEMDERSATRVDPGTREIGALFSSELWWRDHYRDIGIRGYRLRSRYDPDWQPSWRESGKDFFMTEDGQPTLVGTPTLSTPNGAEKCGEKSLLRRNTLEYVHAQRSWRRSSSVPSTSGEFDAVHHPRTRGGPVKAMLVDLTSVGALRALCCSRTCCQ